MNPEKSLECSNYDCIITVHNPECKKSGKIRSIVDTYLKIDPSLSNGDTVVLPCGDLPISRIVVSSLGTLNPDYDDVRSVKEAAFNATKKALEIGTKRPLVVLNEHDKFENAPLMTLLGVLEALYVVSFACAIIITLQVPVKVKHLVNRCCRTAISVIKCSILNTGAVQIIRYKKILLKLFKKKQRISIIGNISHTADIV